MLFSVWLQGHSCVAVLKISNLEICFSQAQLH